MSISKKNLFSIERISTEDGLTLEGIVAKSKNRRKKMAVLFVHGLGGSYGNAVRNKELARACVKNGMAYAIFNNRGHDVVSSFRKKFSGKNISSKHIYGGMAFEKFEECIFDIRAMLKFLEKIGYPKVVLLGHSTGANKVLYYFYKTKDKRVRGLCLAGPLSDIVIEKQSLGRKFYQTLKKVKKFAKRNPDSLLPPSITSRIMTARRYLSLHTPGGAEDTFPYAYKGRGFRELKTIRIPVSVILGEKDSYLDRPAKDLIKVFKKNTLRAKTFHGVSIKGGDHSYYGREREFANAVTDWAKNI
ncbi:MAG: alpha/beta fold hydrolase [bacterium]|nr:alpha/beta fold hydrolase [bacterium]